MGDAGGGLDGFVVDQSAVEHTLARALQSGGEFAEVFVEDRSGISAVMDARRIEELSSGAERGAGVRVIVGDTTGYAHTTDLSERGMLLAAEAASSVARRGGGSVSSVQMEALGKSALGKSAPGKSARLSGNAGAELEGTRLPSEVPKALKIELLSVADEAARSAGGAVSQVQVGYGDSRRKILVANTDGLLSMDDQVRSRFSVSCVAMGDAGMQTGYETAAHTRGFEMFDEIDVAELARVAARRALSKLTARPAPSGEVPVVLAAGSGGILFHEACGHGLEADHIAKDASVYAGRIGEQVASSLVTLVDDGSWSSQWGSSVIDDEGNPTRRNVLIDKGVLTCYLWDFVRARSDHRGSSGNGRRQSYRHLPMVRMTNTFLLDGPDDPDAIVEGTGSGVYVAKLGGGQVNTATGDFVFGTAEAYLIENGRITEPLRDSNLIGNGPEVLRRIDAVAGDFAMGPGTCGKDGQNVSVGCGQPTLRIAGVTMGGTADG